MGGRPRNAEKGEFKAGAKQVEISRRGGIASGAARREKKTLKKCLQMLLEQEMQHNGEKKSGSEIMAYTIFEQAINKNLKAWELIRDTVGEKPVETVQGVQTVVDLSKFSTEEIKKMLDDEI